MPLPRPLRSLAFAAAVAAAIAEIAIGYAEHLPVWLIAPMAVMTAGAVLWGAVALDLLGRRADRPDRHDIAAVRNLQHGNAAALAAHDQRLARLDTRLAMLATERDLAAAERDLALAAEQVETWDTLANDMPHWDAAVARWSAVVASVRADLAPDAGAASDAETRAARDRLPATRNFSSQDLKAAIAYFVQRDRIVVAHERLQAYRLSLTDADPSFGLG